MLRRVACLRRAYLYVIPFQFFREWLLSFQELIEWMLLLWAITLWIAAPLHTNLVVDRKLHTKLVECVFAFNGAGVRSLASELIRRERNQLEAALMIHLVHPAQSGVVLVL